MRLVPRNNVGVFLSNENKAHTVLDNRHVDRNSLRDEAVDDTYMEKSTGDSWTSIVSEYGWNKRKCKTTPCDNTFILVTYWTKKDGVCHKRLNNAQLNQTLFTEITYWHSTLSTCRYELRFKWNMKLVLAMCSFCLL